MPAFAVESGMALRGHNCLWYFRTPWWFFALPDRMIKERVLAEHVRTLVGRYRGIVHSWDVVNEPLGPYPCRQRLSRPQPPAQFPRLDHGQMRRVTRPIRREMKRRAAVEAVIGHLKAEHRNYLKGRNGDRANAVLAAAGYNFALLQR